MNLYGFIEIMIWFVIVFLEEGLKGVLLIGKLIWNMQVYVFDNGLQLVLLGVVGEFYIVGIGLVRGYFCCFDLMVECFVVDLYGLLGVWMYWIGDQVCWCVDGFLDYIGWVDY